MSEGRHPLAVANQVLDLAAARPLPVTNLALQKLMYFMHGWLLASEGRPLVRGGFQAWEHGPVSKAVYGAFKGSGDQPITTRAKVIEYATGMERAARAEFAARELDLMRAVLAAYGHLHPFELSNRTHEPGSPWHRVWTSTEVVPGMQIADELIREHFMDRRFLMKN